MSGPLGHARDWTIPRPARETLNVSRHTAKRSAKRSDELASALRLKKVAQQGVQASLHKHWIPSAQGQESVQIQSLSHYGARDRAATKNEQRLEEGSVDGQRSFSAGSGAREWGKSGGVTSGV